MNLSESQIQVLATIQTKMRRGDVTEIAKNTGFTKAWVGMVLSPSTDDYNDSIINEAVRIIDLREQNTTKLLKKLTA